MAKLSFLVFYFCEKTKDIIETPALFEERALALQGMGYDGLELMVRDAAALDQNWLLGLHQNRGLTVAAIGTGKVFTVDRLSFSDPDESVRNAATARICGNIDLSAQLGCPPVIIGSIRGNVDHGEAGWQRVRDCLSTCARHAAENGVKLALEPMTPDETPYVNSVAEGLRMLEEVGEDSLGLLLDNCILHHTESDLPASIQRAAGRIVHVQLGELDRRYPGHGSYDFPAFFQALYRTGYDGYLSAELEGFDDPLEDAGKGLRYLKETAEAAEQWAKSSK